MNNNTNHIVLVVSDSLRYDSVNRRKNSGLPFLQSKAMTFEHAYSSGCWTLPSHSSIFTGMLPHEHRATTRSRGLREDVQTIAEHLRDRGYKTIQLTANAVTTHIFGLDRGFDEVHRIWEEVDVKNVPFSNLLVLAGKRRIRDKFLKGDFITGKMTEDIRAGQAWVRSLGTTQFEKAEQVLKEADKNGEKVFLFLNLMETHFPYHVEAQFKTLSSGIINKFREMKSLFHLVNQSWLSQDKEYIKPKMLRTLHRRQRLAWKWFSKKVDAFSEFLTTSYPDSLYIFTSDHGDNFGEEGWKYHFSNVTEAGNRVPLFISGPNIPEQQKNTDPVSLRHLYDLIKSAGDGVPDPDVFFPSDNTPTILESYWYNKSGKTLEKYQNDQFAFLSENKRFVVNGDGWHAYKMGNGDSANVTEIPYDANPIYDLELEPEIRISLERKYQDFKAFSESI